MTVNSVWYDGGNNYQKAGWVVHALLRVYVLLNLSMLVWPYDITNSDVCDNVVDSFYLFKWDASTGKDCPPNTVKYDALQHASQELEFCGTDVDVVATPGYTIFNGCKNIGSDSPNLDTDGVAFHYGVMNQELGTDLEDQKSHHCDTPRQVFFASNVAAIVIFGYGTLMMLLRHLGNTYVRELLSGGGDGNSMWNPVGRLWKHGHPFPRVFKFFLALPYALVVIVVLPVIASNPKCNVDADLNTSDPPEMGYLGVISIINAVVFMMDALAENAANAKDENDTLWTSISKNIANPTQVTTDRGENDVQTTTKSLYF